MKVRIKKYNENAVIPQKAYKGDFCYDLTAVSEEQIAPDVWKYGFGFGLQIERGYEPIFVNQEKGTVQQADLSVCPFNLSVDIRPRSSVWKTGMVLSNCEGTVDEGYTNEISAVFYHVNKNLPRYKVGDRIAQMKIGFTFPCDFVEVDKFDETERNMNGYGSSGK